MLLGRSLYNIHGNQRISTYKRCSNSKIELKTFYRAFLELDIPLKINCILKLRKITSKGALRTGFLEFIYQRLTRKQKNVCSVTGKLFRDKNTIMGILEYVFHGRSSKFYSLILAIIGTYRKNFSTLSSFLI